MSFARQSLGSLATLVFGIAASIALARLLGAEARGAYDLSVRLSGLVLAVAQWGIPEVLLQFMGEKRGESSAMVGTSFVLGVGGTAVMGVALALAAPLFGDSLLKGVDPLLVWIAALGSVPVIVGLFSRRFIQLGGRLDLYNLLDVGRNAVFLALAAGLAATLPWPALGALGGWLLAELALATVGALYLWRRLATGWRFERPLAAALLATGLPVQAGVLATFLGNEGGRYVLNLGLDLTAVGVYGVALSVARLVLQISMALRTVLQPRLLGPEADAAAVTERVTRHGLLWMLAVSIGLAVASPLVPFVFGRDFGGSALLLVLMLPGQVAYGVSQLLAGHLLRVGRRAILAGSSWAFAIASVAFQAIGIGLAGVVGAAIGLSLAYLLMVAIVLAAFLRVSGRSVGGLLPRASDLSFYPALARQILAARRGAPAVP